MVAPTGFEPVISGMKTRRPRPLDDSAAHVVSYEGAYVGCKYSNQPTTHLRSWWDHWDSNPEPIA